MGRGSSVIADLMYLQRETNEKWKGEEAKVNGGNECLCTLSIDSFNRSVVYEINKNVRKNWYPSISIVTDWMDKNKGELRSQRDRYKSQN